MKLSHQTVGPLSVLIAIQQMMVSSVATAAASSSLQVGGESQFQSKLIDKCCQIGREKAIDSPKFNCKMSARDALLSASSSAAPFASSHRLHLAAESLLARDTNFADQCELVLESCCMAHHRTKNCDSGKQLAKSGASCMDVELSKEATIATESFNDCCMSCSLGILAARNAAQNETSQSRSTLTNRCKLLSPLASSLSGQLYEQTYGECCLENLPRPSDTLLEPGAPIDCSQANPCSQRCIAAGNYDSASRRVLDQDRCECFAGFKLASDRVNCLDVDECKLGTHSCDPKAEICDNIRGSFRCLARQNQHSAQASGPLARSLFGHHQELASRGDNFASSGVEDFQPLRLCPPNFRWSTEERSCVAEQRSASLFSSSSTGLHLLSSSNRLAE